MGTEYNFWQDLFDTYQSLSDMTKALWLIVPSAFVYGVIALVLRYRAAIRKAELEVPGELVCTVYRPESGDLQIRWHGGQNAEMAKLLLADDEVGSTLAASGETDGSKYLQE